MILRLIRDLQRLYWRVIGGLALVKRFIEFCLIAILIVAAFLLGRAATPHPARVLSVSYQGKQVDHVAGVSGPATVAITEKIDRNGSVSPAGVVVGTP